MTTRIRDAGLRRIIANVPHPERRRSSVRMRTYDVRHREERLARLDGHRRLGPDTSNRQPRLAVAKCAVVDRATVRRPRGLGSAA
jgi:hypothetical protein